MSLLFLRFSPEFRSSNIFAVTEHTQNQIFLERYPKKIFLQNFHGFSKFGFFIVEICILIWDYWVICENYSMRMLSIRENDFIAHWAYVETISSHTEHTPNEFSFYMCSYAEHMGKWFYRTLSIRGNYLNAGWAYEARISSLTEHTRKCLKVEYLIWIEYDFQKSRVSGPWDHKDSVSAKKV